MNDYRILGLPMSSKFFTFSGKDSVIREINMEWIQSEVRSDELEPILTLPSFRWFINISMGTLDPKSRTSFPLCLRSIVSK